MVFPRKDSTYDLVGCNILAVLNTFMFGYLENGMPVCRGTWFIGASGSPSLWQPVSEDDTEQIENSHQALWRAMVSQSQLYKQMIIY
jgi:hypothetical protein